MIGSRRASWRIVSSIGAKQKQKQSVDQEQIAITEEYLRSVEKEIGEVCLLLLQALDTLLTYHHNEV